MQEPSNADQSTQICTSCGLEKPLSNFLERSATQETVYGLICSACRGTLLQSALNRPITVGEFYYLLERFATLTIWNVHNLDRPGELKIINLPDASTHFFVYDRGSCLVASPKNLFSHLRNLEDALQTSRALAGEVYRRGWSPVELAGLDKMTRAARIEIQLLGDVFGKYLEVLHFIPHPNDKKIYEKQAEARKNNLQTNRGSA